MATKMILRAQAQKRDMSAKELDYRKRQTKNGIRFSSNTAFV